MSSTPKFYDRIMESSTTTGTGTYTLAGAITGYQAFSGLGDGNSAYYCAQEVDANGNPSGGWEVGLGTYTASGTTLSRDSVLASSNSNSAVSWSAGTRRIFLTIPASVSLGPQISPVFGMAIVGAKFVRIFQNNAGTGDIDLYTVPTGKRFLFLGYSAWNNTVSTITHFLETKNSGSYYRAGSNSVSTAGATGFNNTTAMYEAGELVSVHTDTTGLNISVMGIEFDAASPLKQARILGIASGDQTLYTCPAGKTALIVSSLTPMMSNTSAMATVVNGTGSSINFFFNSVASGGSPSSSNQLVGNVSVGGSTRGVAFNIVSGFGAGDFLNLNAASASSTGQAFVFIIEI